MLIIRQGWRAPERFSPQGYTLYTVIVPCVLCAGAAGQRRVDIIGPSLPEEGLTLFQSHVFVPQAEPYYAHHRLVSDQGRNATMYRTILFDLGGTLVHMFEREENATVLAECLAATSQYLRAQGCAVSSPAEALQRIDSARSGPHDHTVYPLARRIVNIHGPAARPHLDAACRHFMQPIFERCTLYPDTMPVLEELRRRGCRMAIISNTPWGSPGSLWREQVTRMGLDRYVEVSTFCDDIGWRKPARPLFDYALARLGASARHALVVGDDPRWDTAGATVAGLDSVLLDRPGTAGDAHHRVIRGLDELVDLPGQ
jgi:putative hydrolase of the HAD superfamily